MTDESVQSADRYAALCDRAVEFVDGHNGSVGEELLIRHIFGNSGSPALWKSLLRQVLAAEERLVYHASGEWFLANQPVPDLSGPSLLTDFVAIDVETTGLKPSNQRVIELAMIRYVGGVEERAYETFLNPGRGIPAFITRLTSITDEHVIDAPAFEDVATDVLEFLEGALIVGHNVRFDMGFLNAELGRAGRDPLVNERLDSMGLAVRFLRTLRKPSLDRVADAVGLVPRKLHRAGDDARLTAEVAIRLTAKAHMEGVKSLDHLKSTSQMSESRPRDDVGRARAVLDRSLAHALPKRPGVYLMRDARGEIIYVGKAKNLRERVSSYYSQPIGYTRKMDGLVEAVKQIDHVEVGSEIEALLLESQLIRRYYPRYNTALKKTDHYPYIKVDIGNPWPRVLLSKARADDGAMYFGPYRSASSARKTVDVINAVLPLRTCTRSFRNSRSYGKPCIALDLGQCPGPCVGRADADQYRQATETAVHFLDGRDDALYQRLLSELEAAATKLDFERAARLRKDIQSVTAVLEEQARLRNAEELHNLLVVLPSSEPRCREVMVVVRGVRWAQLRVPTDADAVGRADVAARVAAIFARANVHPISPGDLAFIEEAAILNRWLFRRAGMDALIPLTILDDGAVGGDPADLVDRIIALTDGQIAALDIPPGKPGVGEDAERNAGASPTPEPPGDHIVDVDIIG